jgi:hypothetical protein
MSKPRTPPPSRKASPPRLEAPPNKGRATLAPAPDWQAQAETLAAQVAALQTWWAGLEPDSSGGLQLSAAQVTQLRGLLHPEAGPSDS